MDDKNTDAARFGDLPPDYQEAGQGGADDGIHQRENARGPADIAHSPDTAKDGHRAAEYAPIKNHLDIKALSDGANIFPQFCPNTVQTNRKQTAMALKVRSGTPAAEQKLGVYRKLSI